MAINTPLFNTYTGDIKPSNPEDGALYFDRKTSDMYCFHGGSWKQLYSAYAEPRWTDKLKETLKKL